ncbi:NAD(P)/FAD-dependent oxidoreductase [Flammeovirga sp. SJP92]|uniref:NAD(P)/FAD-dependent oxidoreductase n=1 Tax=Flammeovirga sp. SJP92 TaxID=1775430 RepID=UPI000789467C|nr:FAD-dependent oxidoreductase [Flammeovirga sp. SJP92]KXX66573.1 pyridine nucleotide-disulfide oxidoreductase [Flammeovirga sp. SJP92]
MGNNKCCVIIGGSHGGVNVAFSLRKEGWEGRIVVIDKDPNLPYQRPPLSKTYLTVKDESGYIPLKGEQSYLNEEIELLLEQEVVDVDKKTQSVELQNGDVIAYDFLVLATGASPIIPPIKGIDTAQHLFVMRNIQDVKGIQSALESGVQKVAIIGGGYIGLETASSLKKLGLEVTVFEREEKLLPKVNADELSAFLLDLHQKNGVQIQLKSSVSAITTEGGVQTIVTDKGTSFECDMIIMGVGVYVNQTISDQLALKYNNGIAVNEYCQTSEANVYAVGDCNTHYNAIYGQAIRLESVQNAVDQAKIVAKSITGNPEKYNSLPWFWSDQYDVKLQIAGLTIDADNHIIRKEEENKWSIWFFKGDQIRSVYAINNAKAYVVGMKMIQQNAKLDKQKVINPEEKLAPKNILLQTEINA